MRAVKCPSCRTELRQLETRGAFTKHAGCTTCKKVYIVWDDTLSMCMTPKRCVGEFWQYVVLEAPPKHGPVLPKKKAGAR